jgi:hypothetical protein
MFRHRLAPEADYYRLPAPPPPPFRPASFVLCPVATFSCAVNGDWVHAVYVVAFEQAAETARPALTDRGIFAFWN